MEWVYEPEGFELESGRYLPDFHLPAAGCYVEIKPNVSFSRATRLCAELSRMSGSRVLLIEGQPWPTEYWMADFTDGIACSDVAFAQCRKCDFGCLWWDDDNLSASQILANPMCKSEKYPLPDSYLLDAGDTGWLISAFRAARGARFEHGEIPNEIHKVRIEHQ